MFPLNGIKLTTVSQPPGEAASVVSSAASPQEAGLSSLQQLIANFACSNVGPQLWSYGELIPPQVLTAAVSSSSTV